MKLPWNKRRADRLRLSLPLLLLLALVALSFVACGGAVQVATDKGAKEASGSTPPTPQRIISLSPSTTEVLYGVGTFERVVAVSDYDKFPPEVTRLPRIGGWSNTNLEQVATLKPDLIVMTSSQAPLIKDKLDALGVRTVTVPSFTIADVLLSIEQIGAVTGRDEAARVLMAENTQEVWRELSSVRAVREGRVYSLRDESMLHPSQFVGDTARKFAELIHPQAFGDAAGR